MTNRRFNQNAFTLIELLAVISIIALLAALLFPVAGKAVGQAQKTQCLGNLYNIGLATSMYLSDNDDTYPEIVNFFTRYVPDLGLGRPENLDPRDFESPVQALSPYINDMRSFKCPDDIGSYFYRGPMYLKPHLWQWNDGTSYIFSELFEHQTGTSIAELNPSNSAWHATVSATGMETWGKEIKEFTGLIILTLTDMLTTRLQFTLH